MCYRYKVLAAFEKTNSLEPFKFQALLVARSTHESCEVIVIALSRDSEIFKSHFYPTTSSGAPPFV